MNLKELRKLIAAREISTIILYTVGDERIDCEVWAYGWDGDDVVTHFFGNRLTTERTGQPKTYTSFDRAYFALRGMGYNGKIVLETALFGSNDFDRSNP